MAKQKEAKKLYIQRDGEEASLFLYGYVGDTPYYEDDDTEDLSDLAFIKAFEELKAQNVKKVHIRINSPGGYTSHGLAIITAIQNSTLEIYTWNDGRAWSMAADIWLCVPVERRRMAKNSTLLIHAPSIYAEGTAKDLRAAADQLDAIAEATIAMMAATTGKTADEIRTQYYDYADHTLTYQQCIDTGLVSDAEAYTAAEPTKLGKYDNREALKAAFIANIEKKLNHEIKEKDVTTEQLKAALDNNVLSIEEAEKAIETAKSKKPITVEQIKAVVDDAVKEATEPLKKENEALKLQIEALKEATNPNPPLTEGADTEGQNDPKTPENEAMKKMEEVNNRTLAAKRKA